MINPNLWRWHENLRPGCQAAALLACLRRHLERTTHTPPTYERVSIEYFLIDILGLLQRRQPPAEKSQTLHDKVFISLGFQDMSYALALCHYPPASLGERGCCVSVEGRLNSKASLEVVAALH